MKKVTVLAAVALLIMACGKKENSGADFSKSQEETTTTTSTSDYDPNRGLGKYENMELPATLDHQMADLGEKAAGTKCLSCHKLNSERLVGPGWGGVTERRTPEWIMNFITNPDPMIDQDPELQAQLEICLVRMPNQSVSDDEARQILEYMRKNDGVQ
ncbi:MAG: c-type cytochrome [Flavobacteriaceae bacterium]